MSACAKSFLRTPAHAPPPSTRAKHARTHKPADQTPHRYAVPLWRQSPGALEPALSKLTEGPGMHAVTMSHDCTLFVDAFSSLEVSPQATLYAVSSAPPPPPAAADDANDSAAAPASASAFVVCTLYYKPLPPLTRAPDIVTFPAADGKTPLHGAVYTPDATRFGPPPYRTIVWM